MLFHYETGHLTDHQLSSSESLNAHLGKNGTCKVFPGDAASPSPQAWARFNQTLNGSLIQTVPLAVSCHFNWPEYNPKRCEAITSALNKSSLQYNSIHYSARRTWTNETAAIHRVHHVAGLQRPDLPAHHNQRDHLHVGRLSQLCGQCEHSGADSVSPAFCRRKRSPACGEEHAS